MNKEQIQNLQQRLAYALSEADKAKAAMIAAKTAYDAEFEKMHQEFDAAHQDLVHECNKAESAHNVAQEKAKTIREKAQTELGHYFLQPDAEDKPADGFGKRAEKEAFYDPDELLMEAIDKKASCFLMLDEKAIQKFVVANAEKTTSGNLYEMPQYLRNWMSSLDVMTHQKPLISDKELIKVAPEIEPLELKSDDVSDKPF